MTMAEKKLAEQEKDKAKQPSAAAAAANAAFAAAASSVPAPAASTAKAAANDTNKQTATAPTADKPAAAAASANAASSAPPRNDELDRAASLTKQANLLCMEGKMQEALQKHEQAANIRAVSVADGTLVVENWIAMGYIHVYLGEEDRALGQFEKSYNMFKKKKKAQDIDTRGNAAAMIAQLHRGKMNFKEAIDWYSRGLECAEKGGSHVQGQLDENSLRSEKELCQKLQQEQEKPWLVDVLGFTGVDARFNGRKARLFLRLKKMLMSTGEVVTQFDRCNYSYMHVHESSKGGATIVPEDFLISAPPGAHQNDKSALCGGGISEETEKMEREIVAKVREQLRGKEMDGNLAKSVHKTCEKQYPDMSIPLVRVKNIIKQLDMEEAEVDQDVPKESVDPVALRQQVVEQIQKRFAQYLLCTSCKKEREPSALPVTAVCGHTMCGTW